MKNTTFQGVSVSDNLIFDIIATVSRQDQHAKIIFYVSELNFTSIFSTFLVFFYKCSVLQVF